MLIGAATTGPGHVSSAIQAAGGSRTWRAYYWLVEYGRWSWLAVWRALIAVLTSVFRPPVWHVILDDTLVERYSQKAPDARVHFNHAAKRNRPRFLWGQGWVCLAAVVERGCAVGAVPLLLRLVRTTGQKSKLTAALVLLRALDRRLGAVRVLTDAWYMRARLILWAMKRGFCVIGRVRKDLALYLEPPPPTGKRGRPRKYGARVTAEMVARLPVMRSAQRLYGGKLEVGRYRTCCVAARCLKGELVRAVWVQLERPDRPDRSGEDWLLLCTDPLIPAIEVVQSYAKRWAVESLFFALKQQWGFPDAWQQTRLALMRWATILSAGYALNQILAFADAAAIGALSRPAPWRPATTRTAGTIRDGLLHIFRAFGMERLLPTKSPKMPAPEVPRAAVPV